MSGNDAVSGVRHEVFQTSLMSAFLDGVYDGELSVAELLERGDFGLGTFNALDGEMVVLDGICYQLHDGGRARLADPDQLSPFAVVTSFDPMVRAELPENSTRAEVAAIIGESVSSENYLYAIRIVGEFSWVSTRTAARQRKPYRPLRVATRNEPVIRFDNIDGVVAGFRTPLYEPGSASPVGMCISSTPPGNRAVTYWTTSSAVAPSRSASARICISRCR